MISRSSATSPTASRSCTSARSSSSRRRRALRAAAAPLHGGAPLGDPDARLGREAQADHAHRRRAEPDEPAERLPLPHALPDRAADLRRGRAAARRPRRGPLGRLPLRRHADPGAVQAPAWLTARRSTPGCCTTSGCRCATGSRSRPTSTCRSAGRAPDDRPVDALRVDARALHRAGASSSRSAAMRPSSSTFAAGTSPGGKLDPWVLDGSRRAGHADVGRRRAVVQRTHRDLGPELRRRRPVAARSPRAPESRSASRRT